MILLTLELVLWVIATVSLVKHISNFVNKARKKDEGAEN